MNKDGLLKLIQQLLTMVEDEPTSIQCAKTALESVFALAHQSKKCDRETIIIFDHAILNFKHLVRHRADFAGKPGDYAGNEAKRRQLEMVLRPHC